MSLSLSVLYCLLYCGRLPDDHKYHFVRTNVRLRFSLYMDVYITSQVQC